MGKNGHWPLVERHTGDDMSKWRTRAFECFPGMRSEIERAQSVADLWVELICRVHTHYRSGLHENAAEPSDFFHGVCLYATWCARSESHRVQDAAVVEFYQHFPRFALECPEPVYRSILAELVSNIGVAEVEKMGVGLKESDRERFIVNAREADDERRRRSRKR